MFDGDGGTLSPAKTSPGGGREGTSKKNVIVSKRNKKRNNILGKVKTAQGGQASSAAKSMHNSSL